jgi:hypothetical protein
MNSADSNPDPNHQSIIRMMGDSKPPPADEDTPEIPEELLKRLKEKYGSKVEPIIPFELPQKKEADAPRPTIMGKARRIFFQPKFAVAASLVLLGSIAALWQTPELMRGSAKQPSSLQSYWLSQSQPAPKGLGLPTFIVTDQAPSTGSVILCDPTQRTATLMREGQTQSVLTIEDPADSDEWLSAYRQLSTQP